MTKLHITLVGGQTAPVYQGIIDSNPDKVFFVYSEQTEAEAKRILSEIAVLSESFPFDPVDLSNIEKGIRDIDSKINPSDHVSINIGGGTKPWSVLFYAYFGNRENTKLIYIDQNNFVWDFKTKTKHQIVFDMDVQFRLYGNPLTNYKAIGDFSTDDFEAIDDIKALRKLNFQDFKYMTEFLTKQSNEVFVIGKSGSTIDWLPNEKSFKCLMKDKSGKELRKRLNSKNVRNLLLNSGWFELHVAKMLSQWNKAKDIRMNCIFQSTKGSPKNEIDIIVNTGSKLLFVECKTQIKNETDIDKFASAVKIYGGMGSKALFITEAPMSDKAVEKCIDNGIMYFSLQNSIDVDSIEKFLFVKLEAELFNINTK